MNLRVVIHEEENGGYWAEVPSLPGCATEGDTYDELIANVKEAVQGWLLAGLSAFEADPNDRVIELAI